MTGQPIWSNTYRAELLFFFAVIQSIGYRILPLQPRYIQFYSFKHYFSLLCVATAQKF